MVNKLDRVVTSYEVLLPIKSHPLCSRGLPKQGDILKQLYLHYHNAYGHQLWQTGDLPWGLPNHRAAWPFKITLSCEITWQIKTVISSLSQCLCNNDLRPIKQHNPLITRSCEVSWQIKYITYPLTLGQWPANMARLRLKTSIVTTHKIVIPFNHMVLWSHLTN